MSNTEKVSVNMNIGTLSQIDLLVDQGYYSDRSDFINQSVREALNLKQDKIKAEEKYYDKWDFFWFMGVRVMLRNELEQIKEIGHKKMIKGPCMSRPVCWWRKINCSSGWSRIQIGLEALGDWRCRKGRDTVLA